ncbi:hypothetical protein Hdeb2414_s0004g00128951 [Helianthus debilis subsp. tardiflorus]
MIPSTFTRSPMSPASLASLSDLCPNSPLEDPIKPWNNHHHLILCTFCVSLLVAAGQLCNSGCYTS